MDEVQVKETVANAEEILGELSEMNEKLKAAEEELGKYRAAYGSPDKDSEFEQFLKQFPEADADSIVKGVVSGGDFKRGNFTREYVRALRAKVSALEEENSSEEAITQKALKSEKATEAIVREYLKSVSGAHMTAAPSVKGGGSPALPPSKPKSIGEAGILARDIFQNS